MIISFEDVMGVEIDELEEDLEWSISCLKGVMGVEVDELEGVIDVEEVKLEEELVDKPETTTRTKFSVLHCIRIPFLLRCGF